MTFKSIEIVNVKYCLGDEILTMGRLAINNRKIYFEYDADFLETKFELSPFKFSPLRKDSFFNLFFNIISICRSLKKVN